MGQETKENKIIKLTGNGIRRRFIEFFSHKKHRHIPSSSLAPKDDPTLLFTNAGMNQFKKIFLGDNQDRLKRAVNSQKCLRVSGKHNDLDEVGQDGTHHTFFEMLGNWSFGDYYKKEAIIWAWEFLTEVLKLPKNRLFVTVYQDDAEAKELWLECTDIEAKRVLNFGKEDNFWEMGEVGPCGPCSEIHFDTGDFATQQETFSDLREGVNSSHSQRYVEIWNLVFMQYERKQDGSLHDLKEKHVDTGAGLERLAAIVQGRNSNYETDLFWPIIEKIVTLSKVPYDPGVKGMPHRVLADHLRALCFTIADGVTPGNEGRSYVMRRILRRACRFAHKLGQKKPFLYLLIPSVLDFMSEAYPELRQRQDYITAVIKAEEERFLKTLASGLDRLEKLLEKLKERKEKTLSGEDVFLFHDTYGFPFDLTQMIAEEKDFSVDYEAYKICMEEQKTRARSHAKFDDSFATSENWTVLNKDTSTHFIGYETLELQAKTTRYLEQGDELYLVLDQTPFYAEAGGQVGDQGTLFNEQVKLYVSDTVKILDWYIHKCQLIEGLVSEQTLSQLSAKVDKERRERIKRHHSATHLLHAALQLKLGTHIEQQGSYVGPDRLRFDFTHHSSLTKEEIHQIEDLVCQQVHLNQRIKTDLMDLKEAKESGAMALFGEKYSEKVRVLTIGSFSKELCGGTHLEATGQLGSFRITAESSISSGVRRIEAVAGWAAVELERQDRETVSGINELLKAKPEQILIRVKELSKEVKRLEKESLNLKKANLAVEVERILKSDLKKPLEGLAKTYTFISTLSAKKVPQAVLQDFLDIMASRLGKEVAVFTHVEKENLSIIVAVGKELLPQLHAGKLVKKLADIAGGKGGGRPEKARAGSRKLEKEQEILTQARNLIKDLLH